MLFMNQKIKKRENNVYIFLLFKVKYNGIDLNYIFSIITLSTYNKQSNERYVWIVTSKDKSVNCNVVENATW